MANLGDDDRAAENIRQNRTAWSSSDYFGDAEAAMDDQWTEIGPLVRQNDLACVLELAPGHGRNSERLIALTDELYLVDLNESCIKGCRKRLAPLSEGKTVHYLVGDGRTLTGVPDAAITFVYSFDSMVHFDRQVVREYLREFARVMKPGARGIVHYSNYGAQCEDPDSPWHANPEARSTMTRELFHAYCAEAGLSTHGDRLIDWEGYKALDCATLFRRD